MKPSVPSPAMKLLTALLVALLALVAGCAPGVVGGEWHSGPRTASGVAASDVVLVFSGSSVEIRVANARDQQCSDLYDRATTSQWFVNGAGRVVITGRAQLEVPHCDRSGGLSRTFDVFGVLDGVVGTEFVFEGENRLVSRGRDPQIAFQRR